MMKGRKQPHKRQKGERQQQSSDGEPLQQREKPRQPRAARLLPEWAGRPSERKRCGRHVRVERGNYTKCPFCSARGRFGRPGRRTNQAARTCRGRGTARGEGRAARRERGERAAQPTNRTGWPKKPAPEVGGTKRPFCKPVMRRRRRRSRLTTRRRIGRLIADDERMRGGAKRAPARAARREGLPTLPRPRSEGRRGGTIYSRNFFR